MEEALEHALQICAEKGLGEEATDAYHGAYEADRAADSLGIDGTASGKVILRRKTEVSFRNLEQLPSVSVLLSEDERMRLKGRIDRVDICREQGNVYVRSY